MNEIIREPHNSNWLTLKQGTLCRLKWIFNWPLGKCLAPRVSPLQLHRASVHCLLTRAEAGDHLQNRGCCAEGIGVSQCSCFYSADINYSLLNVNGGNISPTQRSSLDGPVVFTGIWEQKHLPPETGGKRARAQPLRE